MKFIIVAMILSNIVMMASFYLSKKTFMDKEKTTPFECGFDPHLMPRAPFSLRFFKLAIIFLIFDVEIALILPLPLLNSTMNIMFLKSSLFVLVAILAGLLYEWQQGSLDWMK